MSISDRTMNVDVAVAQAARATDSHLWSRLLAAVLVALGPAAVAVLRFILPYSTTDDSAHTVAAVYAAPGRQSAVLWLSLIAILTLVPAALWVASLTRSRAPRMTIAALILLIPGYLSMGYLASIDLQLWAGAAEGVDIPTMIRLSESVHPTTVIGTGVFVLGHVLGTVLLGIAIWRSNAAPRWAALLVIASQPLHLSAVILSSPTLDLVGWGMQAAGFAIVAAVWLPHSAPHSDHRS